MIIQRRCCAICIEIALAGSVYPFVFQRLLVILIGIRRIFQQGFALTIQFSVIDLLFFLIALSIALNDRNLPCPDVYGTCFKSRTGNTGDIRLGGVFHTAIGKRTLETITAAATGIGCRQSTVNLGSAFLCIHRDRLEFIGIGTATDPAYQVVFQIADSYRAAHACIGAAAAA